MHKSSIKDTTLIKYCQPFDKTILYKNSFSLKYKSIENGNQENKNLLPRMNKKYKNKIR
jgi:hypothetical protein